MKSRLKLSIVTVCFNEAEGIQKTIDSIVNQSFKDFEWIVIDGGSNDDTLEKLKSHEKRIDVLISEPDEGIYHAMNKGISLSSGEYILFMNGGDSLYNNSILKEIFRIDVKADIIYGDTQIEGENIHNQVFKMPPTLKRSFYFYKSIPHQSMMTKRSLLEKVGGFSLKYQIASDFHFSLYCLHILKCSFHYLPIIFSNSNADGISNSQEKQRIQEKIIVRREVYGKISSSIINFLYEIGHKRKRIISILIYIGKKIFNK